MNKYFTLLTAAVFSCSSVFSQCVEVPKNRVLLVGDSWAAFMNADQTITNALKNAGHSDKKYTTSFSIAENGADTWDYVAGPKLDDIQNLIDANPDIDIVHLSIGGNDLLGDWHVSFTQEETDSLAGEVEDRLLTIIEFLKNTRPGMRVFWAGYTYPNFGEVINDIAPAQSAHPFYDTWDGMGQPNFEQINSLLNDMSDSVALYAAADPQLDFVRAQGILQYMYGQASPLGIAPGGTYLPFELPLPLGDPTYPSPKSTMRPYGFFTDCFHLSTEGYLTMLSYQTQKFYHKFFMDDYYVLSEGGDMDGSVSSAGDISQTIKFGEEGGNEVAAVVSFDTQQMADTTLAGASIFLRRESLAGTSPVSGINLLVKMANGNFGTSANVEAVDYTAVGDADGEPCKHGSTAENGHWLRLDLTAEMLAMINNGSKTQFTISAPGFTGGTMTFSDATDPELAPVLNLIYGPSPNGINDLVAESNLPVYPMPTVGPLTIGNDNGNVVSVEVMNVLGAVVLTPTVNNNRIDISELPNGSYVLRITTKEGTSAKRIIKR